MVLKETALSELPDVQSVREVALEVADRAHLNFTDRDVEAYGTRLQDVLNRKLKSTLIDSLKNTHSVPFTNAPRRALDTLGEIVEWFNKARAYKEECEQIRQEFSKQRIYRSMSGVKLSTNEFSSTALSSMLACLERN